MIYKEDIVDINLNTGNIHRTFLAHTIGYKDQKADHFGVRVFRDGEAVDLTGVSVQGIFMPPQGDPIAITSGNSVSGNVAYVVLPQACYNYDGQFCLAIKLVDSTNSITGTVRIVDGVVDNTHASGTVAPTSAVPTYQEILSTYDAMVAATAAANGAIAATYSSSATYAVGDYCIHDGGLYRCTTAITTAEAWTSGHWTAAKLGTDLSAQKSAFESVENYYTPKITGQEYYFMPPVTNEIISGAGAVSSNSLTRLTDYIELKKGVQLYLSFLRFDGSSVVRFAYFDASKNFLKREVPDNLTDLTRYNIKLPHYVHVSSGVYTEAKYVRICYDKNIGELVIYENKKSISEISQLIYSQIDKGFGFYPSDLTLDDVVKLNGVYFHNGQTHINSNPDRYCFYFPCIPNQTYHILKEKDTVFGVGTTDDIPVLNTLVSNIDYSEETVERASNLKFDIKTVQTGANDKYIIVYYARMDTGNYSQDKDALFSSIRISGPTFRKKQSFVTPQMFCIRPDDPLNRDMSDMFDIMIEYMQNNGIRNIYLPNGKYWGNITVGANTLERVNIYGDGSGTMLCGTAHKRICISINTTIRSSVHDLTIIAGTGSLDDLTVDEFLGAKWYGIYAENARFLKIFNVSILALTGCIWLKQCLRPTISSSNFSNTIYDNSNFNSIDNSSYDCPGGNVSYQTDSFIALLPYIHNSYAILLHQSVEAAISDVYIYCSGRGVLQHYGSSGMKMSNVEMEMLGNVGLWIRQGGSQITNTRIDQAGLFDNYEAILLDKYPGDENQIADFITLTNVTVLQCNHGAIRIGESVNYLNMTALLMINNSTWYNGFFHYHQDAEPTGWEPAYELVVEPNVSRTKIDGTIIAITQRITSWNGHSNGLLFEEDENHHLTQRLNDVNIRFGYDETYPDGYQGMPEVIQHSEIPEGNRVIWNCEDIS